MVEDLAGLRVGELLVEAWRRRGEERERDWWWRTKCGCDEWIRWKREVVRRPRRVVVFISLEKGEKERWGANGESNWERQDEVLEK